MQTGLVSRDNKGKKGTSLPTLCDTLEKLFHESHRSAHPKAEHIPSYDAALCA
jgi:hypothetical protein